MACDRSLILFPSLIFEARLTGRSMEPRSRDGSAHLASISAEAEERPSLSSRATRSRAVVEKGRAHRRSLLPSRIYKSTRATNAGIYFYRYSDTRRRRVDVTRCNRREERGVATAASHLQIRVWCTNAVVNTWRP